jgi:hypothetical protein
MDHSLIRTPARLSRRRHFCTLAHNGRDRSAKLSRTGARLYQATASVPNPHFPSPYYEVLMHGEPKSRVRWNRSPTEIRKGNHAFQVVVDARLELRFKRLLSRSTTSITISFLSVCGSLRRPPACSRQRCPAGTPHIGHGSEGNCFLVKSLIFIPEMLP